MCCINRLLTLVVICFQFVNSWDIAVTSGDQIEFYTSNGTKAEEEGFRFKDLTALAYDAVHNILLFVDKQNDNASIFSFHLANKRFQPLVSRSISENIQGLAFDPVKGILFWTDSNERSIFWISLAPGSKNNGYGTKLLQLTDEIPRGIAVDSCRGYIYWTNTNTAMGKPSIERARFDGTERQIIIDSDIFMPVSIAIDNHNKKLYWADDKEGIHYTIESSDLDGENRKILYAGTNHQPNALTVSKDSVFWTDWMYKSVWQLEKNSPNAEPVQIVTYKKSLPFGVVASLDIEKEISGIPECQTLASVLQNKTALNETFKSVSRNEGLFCLHGERETNEMSCKCTLGYTGMRCEISVCKSYCLFGECTVSEIGEPVCSCPSGYSGNRCENNVCQNYCLNNGLCSANPELTCDCLKGYEGKRCEIKTTISITPSYIASDVCNCTKENYKGSTILTSGDTILSTQDSLFVETTCTQEWDFRDPIIIVLGTVTALLCVLCAVLITKIVHLRKRPRIKKRIIVNKNVTPLTARPDQCEITIENCCNMNICETPCFEPRTIRPGLMVKSGKEEKSNLIANMEHPDDIY